MQFGQDPLNTPDQAPRFSHFLMRPLLLCLLLLLAPLGASATTAAHGPSPEVAAENAGDKVEIARLRLQNVAGGLIEGSRDGGTTWTVIGHIVLPVVKVNRMGYNASKYGPPGTVVASAVNAIHLKAGQNTEQDRGIIWSLAPAPEPGVNSNSLQTEVSPASAAYTDMPGGSGVFGGVFTPFVGNTISLDPQRNNGLVPLPDGYVPHLGDSWVIVIARPRHYPEEIVFENRFGGRITIKYRYEEPKVIGEVLKPVLGIGRFVGSYYASTGRLRANHNGVIDISTSPRGAVGSFQIVPANHAMSPETHYIRELTQWMVVGPASVDDPSWEGTAPLFSGFLRPRFDPADLDDPDPVEGLAGRFYFDVKMQGSTEWQPFPQRWVLPNEPLPKWADTCLEQVTEIRIRFPFAWDDPKYPKPEAPIPATIEQAPQ